MSNQSFIPFLWLLLRCLPLFVRCPLSSMSHDVRKLRRTERSPRPIVHLKSGDTRISLRRIRSDFRNCEGIKSLCVRQSLFISATTTPNKSLVAQRNVRSLNCGLRDLIHTVSEQVSSSLDLVSLSLFVVESRIPQSLLRWISYPTPLPPINVTTPFPMVDFLLSFPLIGCHQ